MDFKSRLKNAGMLALGLVVMVAFFLITALLVRGTVWASERALPWLDTAARVALEICTLVFLPLCIFRRTRRWAGLGFWLSSFVFGTLLFAFSTLVVADIW